VAREAGSAKGGAPLLLHVTVLGVIGLCLGLFFRTGAVLAVSLVVAASVGGYSVLDGHTLAAVAMRVAGSLAILQIAYAGGLLLSGLRAKKP
jgi:hypothetical protein